MKKFSLVCSVDNSPVTLSAPFDFTAPCHENSLLKDRYANTKLHVHDDLPGLWKYIEWLPVNSPNEYAYGPVTYKSDGLARELGLSNLWISFNGYYPDFGAYYKSCTFKELHAVVVIQYAREHGVEKLAMASAGNTAVAFAYIAEMLKYPVALVVPEKCMRGVNVPNMLIEYSKLITLKDGDYSDAQDITRRLCKLKGYVYEGGCKNFARRAGLAVTYYDAVTQIGKIPDHYFQAVGSGTGAVAAWHANELFQIDGSYGAHLTRLHLAQNIPMIPMVNAWNNGRNYIDHDVDIPDIDNILDVISARVLSTKYPAYEVAGGVYDALKATGGHMYAITNEEIATAGVLFKQTEGRDILPAPCVAVAALRHAVKDGKVKKDDIIMINITGAGKEQRLRDLSVQQIKPNAVIDKNITDEQIKELNL